MAKRDLANGCPHNVEELMDDLVRSIERIRRSPAKLRGCIKQSELPLFCVDHCIFYARIYNFGREGLEVVENWWAVQDLNLRPPACKAGALTN